MLETFPSSEYAKVPVLPSMPSFETVESHETFEYIRETNKEASSEKRRKSNSGSSIVLVSRQKFSSGSSTSSSSSESVKEDYKCPQCDSTFNTKSKLVSHMRDIHKSRKKKRGENLRGCPECGTRHKSKAEMYIHRLIHFGDPGLHCPFCRVEFRVYENLQQHAQLQHVLGEQYICPVCPELKTYSHKSTLLLHIEKKHFVTNDEGSPQQGRFSCHYCNHTFRTEPTLKRHIRNTHGN